MPQPFTVIGLTGSVAMGKSTTAAMMRRRGLPVFDSDAAVHDLTGRNGAALAAIATRFGNVVGDAGVDRARLGKAVFGDPQALADLEDILHPLVAAARRRWYAVQARRMVRAVVIDVPLLFETGGDGDCDAVFVVSAPAFLQRQRALARPGMTSEKLAAILARQLPDADKRRLATHVLPTGLGKRETLRALCRALHDVGV